MNIITNLTKGTFYGPIKVPEALVAQIKLR